MDKNNLSFGRTIEYIEKHSYSIKKENYYVVNPYVVWKGSNIENAKAIIKYCMIK